MGDKRGYLKVKRDNTVYRPACERVKDYSSVSMVKGDRESKEQASRCMDCGTPFCNFGCPLGNYIPEWNDHVFNGQWEKAIQLLDATNNLPEVTGRICPAICEYACVLGINDDPVTIRENELSIIERAFKHGHIKPNPPLKRTGKKVAVVGSGPAGLAAAAQLNKAGHKVYVFEKDDMVGGIMRYGIPDFKLEKKLLDRRIDIWKKEGIEFVTSTNVGTDQPASHYLKNFDAVCLAGGSRVPRDLKINGRELKGVHFAMDYLIQSNKRVAGYKFKPDEIIDAKGKKVVVIGGGDTGADCVGTAHRQGAFCVVQIELLPEPPKKRPAHQPWPLYPMIFKSSSSHEEGGTRDWSVLTKEFIGKDGNVSKLSCIRVGCDLKEIPNSTFEIESDLVVLALGFLNPEQTLVTQLGLDVDNRHNIKTDDQYMTSKRGIFAAGDMRRGQSLIVWAISEGRKAAYNIDKYLMGKSSLPLI
jgi:glutamate synthase (NADPH) small chain